MPKSFLFFKHKVEGKELKWENEAPNWTIFMIFKW